MKTPEQLKGAIRNIAKQKELHAQEVLQIFMFERILDRLSLSQYKKNFILKGGLLISSMIGISERTTMDMDTTVRGIDMDEANLEQIIKEILSIDAGDGISFQFKKMEPIREDDDYNNFRVHFIANYGKIRNKMKIDITTGDEITPSAIAYSFHTMFDEKDIEIYAYTLETILAEKYETIIRRGITNTRSRDFYDLHVLFHLYKDEINPAHFKIAVEHTVKKRNSIELMDKYEAICEEIRNEESLASDWHNYVNDETYAAHLSFDDVVQNALEVGNYLKNIPESD
ncbi:MAG: nucleotidyl transferase AbiEii/AbiGii toxin family protein [Lachnospiraceae bacterium]|nr:nucleotidyl transferase AbiEii/AbiGii toxin family protein [Lachnospiraceae bacterium]